MDSEILIEIRDLLKQLIQNQNALPRMVYAKELEENYKINLNKANEFCFRYGTKFGGYCIESTKLQEVLHNADMNLFD